MIRRGFLGACLAAAAAPAIVRAASIMPIYTAKPGIQILWGDGSHDDSLALNHYLAGGIVLRPGLGLLVPDTGGTIFLPAGNYAVGQPAVVSETAVIRGSVFTGLAELRDRPWLVVGRGARNVAISGCTFTSDHKRPTGIAAL